MKLEYYETCNNQYHRGHHLPTVQVMVDGKTTMGQVKEALLDSFAYEHLEYDVLTTEGHYDAYKKAVDAWCDACYLKEHETWYSTLEVPEDGDDEWDCYSYFVLSEIDEHLVEKIRKNPNVCPYCGSDKLMSKFDSEPGEPGTMNIRAVCNDCQETWVENYGLEGATFGDRD